MVENKCKNTTLHLLHTVYNWYNEVHHTYTPVHMRVCVCWCLPVISEILETGRCSATLLSPSCQASPGELRPLLLELTGHMVREEKP